MLDAPGPWGTGPFVLASGYSSILNKIAIINDNPFMATWLTEMEERTPKVILKANSSYWKKSRGPRIREIEFRNDLSAEEALNLCTTTEGQVDIVTEVQPVYAKKVLASQFAKLVAVDGNKIFTGVFNRYKQDINFRHQPLRLAINLAVDREELIAKGFMGFAKKVPALTLPWATDFSEELTPYKQEPERARELLKGAGWPKDRILHLAVSAQFELAADVIRLQLQQSLQIEVKVTRIPKHEEVNWMRVVAEKKLVPSWDILLACTNALFTEASPAFFHREFLGEEGMFRTGPIIPRFTQLYERFIAEIDKTKQQEIAKEIDRYTYHESLGLFLCSPQNLYAVNRHVHFQPYRTTFELIDTEVSESHWSRR